MSPIQAERFTSLLVSRGPMDAGALSLIIRVQPSIPAIQNLIQANQLKNTFKHCNMARVIYMMLSNIHIFMKPYIFFLPGYKG
jgi:hypothetical protein